MRAISLLEAAIPFIAIWKNDPNNLRGRKNSAASRIIKVRPNIFIEFFENSKIAMPMPAAVPP